MIKKSTTGKYIAICTRCGDLFANKFVSKQEIINEITYYGWDATGNTHICEKCIDELLNTRGKQREDYQAFIQVVRDFIRTYHLTRKWQEYIHNCEHVEIIEKMARKGK